MQNSGPSNNRGFGNRPFNSDGGNQNNFGGSFQNDRFEQANQNSNGNFQDDFDLNEFSKTIDRPGNNRLNFNARQDFGGNDNSFGNSNWKGQNQNQFNQRGGGNNSFGSTNNRFNNSGNSNRNFQSNEEISSGQHYIHMRGLPYYTDEMDVFNVSSNENKRFKCNNWN